MKFELKNFLINICGWITLISMCFFLVVFIIFIEDKVQQPFKETLTLTLSFLSAIATIGAAIIAARIFQTWKTQHSYVEQTKLLGQMLQTVSSLLSAIIDARQNDNLRNIFLGNKCKVPMEEAFTGQVKQAELLDTFLTELNSLENQIYLLNNTKGASQVFTKDEQGKNSFDNIVELVTKIQVDILFIYDVLSINNGNGTFVISNLKINEPSIQKKILSSAFYGDKLLKKALPDVFTQDENPVNTEIRDCIADLKQSILKYKDSLDTIS